MTYRDLRRTQLSNPSLLEPLQASLQNMQSYLRGAMHLGTLIRHHAIVWTSTGECSPGLASSGPNVLLRRTVGGYALVTKLHGHAAVVHNLAGFITVLNIKGNPRDNWYIYQDQPIRRGNSSTAESDQLGNARPSGGIIGVPKGRVYRHVRQAKRKGTSRSSIQSRCWRA